MKPSYCVNGAALDVDPGVSPLRVLNELQQQGWSVIGVRVDGEVRDLGELDASPDASLVEFEASLPDAASGGPETATGEGDIPPLEIEPFVEQLHATLAGFSQQALALGESFSRGEWRRSLQVLLCYLEEFGTAVSGFKLVETDHRQYAPLIAAAPEWVAQLSELIERQSWVEVSDFLLYEMSPRLEDWAQPA